MGIGLAILFAMCAGVAFLGKQNPQPNPPPDPPQPVAAVQPKPNDPNGDPAKVPDPDKNPVATKNTGTAPTAEGQKYVRDRLAELDSFKDDPKFHEIGFGLGGPYNKWLKAVEPHPSREVFSFPERVAIGDLMNMGFDYMKSRGQETKYTKFARAEIMKMLVPTSVTPSVPKVQPEVVVAPSPRLIDPSIPLSPNPTEWVRLGSIETRVIGAVVDRAPLRDKSGNDFRSADPVLRVWIETRAVAPPKKELRRWASSLDPAKLNGPPGMPIAKSKAGSGATILGELVGGHKLIPGGEAVPDVILFVPPPPSADTIVLTLDGEHVGEAGVMRHIIGQDRWKK